MSVATGALDTGNRDDVVISVAVVKANHVSFIGRVNLMIRGAATERTGLMNNV